MRKKMDFTQSLISALVLLSVLAINIAIQDVAASVSQYTLVKSSADD